ncbi:MAG: ABC transporter ATP-binding protein [Myxococcota bacterium]|nr:ABC transporter ATP-binding protein [Myxococcota bacterium]
MEEILEASPVPTTAPLLLRTHQLRRSFGKFEAVRGVSLELAAGQIYGFLGRNGAGKTTTLRMLIGVLRPDSGEIELLGERGPKVRPAQRQRVGYLSQEQVFYPWMTGEQLGQFMSGFYSGWDPAEFDRLLRLLDVPKDRKARFLSGGTRAKLGLALALSHHPSLLILDEPTAGLDPVARREFLDILASQIRREGQAVLFSSHLVSEVEQVCDRIGILQDGQLRFQGALTQLLASHRQVRVTAETLLPPQVETIRAEPTEGGELRVLRADSALWAEDGLALLGPRTLTLEEIFLAYARRTPRA